MLSTYRYKKYITEKIREKGEESVYIGFTDPNSTTFVPREIPHDSFGLYNTNG